jgi:hypothetical protein
LWGGSTENRIEWLEVRLTPEMLRRFMKDVETYVLPSTG